MAFTARYSNRVMGTISWHQISSPKRCTTMPRPRTNQILVHTRVVRNWRRYLTYSTRHANLQSFSGLPCINTTSAWCSSCSSHWEEVRALGCRIVPIVILLTSLTVAASVTLVAGTSRTQAITVVTHFRIQACQRVGLPTNSVELTVDTTCWATGLTTDHIDLASVCRANACEAVGLPTNCVE